MLAAGREQQSYVSRVTDERNNELVARPRRRKPTRVEAESHRPRLLTILLQSSIVLLFFNKTKKELKCQKKVMF